MDRKEKRRIVLRYLQKIKEEAYCAYLVESYCLDYNLMVEGHLDTVMLLINQCIEAINMEVD